MFLSFSPLQAMGKSYCLPEKKNYFTHLQTVQLEINWLSKEIINELFMLFSID